MDRFVFCTILFCIGLVSANINAAEDLVSIYQLEDRQFEQKLSELKKNAVPLLIEIPVDIQPGKINFTRTLFFKNWEPSYKSWFYFKTSRNVRTEIERLGEDMLRHNVNASKPISMKQEGSSSSFIEASFLPFSYKLLFETDLLGKITKNQASFPHLPDTTHLPIRGQLGYIDLIAQIVPFHFSKDQVGQNNSILRPVFETIGLPIENATVDRFAGRPPIIRGIVPCGRVKCLFLEIGEGIEMSVNDSTYQTTVKGYQLIESKTLQRHNFGFRIKIQHISESEQEHTHVLVKGTID